MMTKKLFKYFIHPYQNTWNQLSSIEKVLATTSLEEFEKEYFEMAGFEDYQSYCQAINPIYVFENVKIPLMILNAEDDPVCSIKNLEPYKETIQQMSNIAVITTKKGSHCGFYEGWKSTSWAAKLISNYFLVEHKQ
jgi:predicted alpha/beta-fold hydrolase